MISVCRRRSVGSKRWWESSVGSVCSVRERTTQELSSALSLTVSAFYFSQKNTEEQISQRPTETLSQPISQNVTANVSWKASVTSVCRRPSVGSKRAQKGSVKSVYSVREKLPQELIRALKTSVNFARSVREKLTHELTRALKTSVNFVCSVRDKTPQRERKTSPLPSSCPSRLQKGLDNISEHALLARRTCPSCPKKGMFLKGTYNILISCRLQAWL